jgi:hypothetical protein
MGPWDLMSEINYHGEILPHQNCSSITNMSSAGGIETYEKHTCYIHGKMYNSIIKI